MITREIIPTYRYSIDDMNSVIAHSIIAARDELVSRSKEKGKAKEDAALSPFGPDFKFQDGETDRYALEAQILRGNATPPFDLKLYREGLIDVSKLRDGADKLDVLEEVDDLKTFLYRDLLQYALGLIRNPNPSKNRTVVFPVLLKEAEHYVTFCIEQTDLQDRYLAQLRTKVETGGEITQEVLFRDSEIQKLLSKLYQNSTLKIIQSTDRVHKADLEAPFQSIFSAGQVADILPFSQSDGHTGTGHACGPVVCAHVQSILRTGQPRQLILDKPIPAVATPIERFTFCQKLREEQVALLPKNVKSKAKEAPTPEVSPALVTADAVLAPAPRVEASPAGSSSPKKKRAAVSVREFNFFSQTEALKPKESEKSFTELKKIVEEKSKDVNNFLIKEDEIFGIEELKKYSVDYIKALKDRKVVYYGITETISIQQQISLDRALAKELFEADYQEYEKSLSRYKR